MGIDTPDPLCPECWKPINRLVPIGGGRVRTEPCGHIIDLDLLEPERDSQAAQPREGNQ